jgi:D-glycero-alpha-D-manno-heptose 1-phosphate guanylyltransferase
MKAVVLCGGLGTRLGALTRETPKPLLEVAGRPFISHVLDHLAANGTTEIVLAVSFQWQKLRGALGSSWQGLPLHYSVEPEPMGTGGAVRHAMDQLGWVEAIVANGDTLLKMNPNLLHGAAGQHSADMVMALKRVDDASRYGRVRIEADSRVVGFEEKGQSGEGLINAGLYWMRARVLDKAPDRIFSLERDLMAEHVTELAMYGVETSGYFVDMGIPEDLERARRELS